MKLLLMLLLVLSCDKSENKEPTDYRNITNPSLFSWQAGKGLEVVEVRSTIRVGRGKTFDGKFKLYKWVGYHKEYCHWPTEVSEKEPPMFILDDGATIKNMYIECSLDAFKAGNNTTFDTLYFMDVEEDAISISGKSNVVIRNSIFVGAQDKAIQVNPNSGYVHMENNAFYDTRVAVKYDGNKTFTAKNNSFYNVKYALRTTQGGTMRSFDNHFKRVTCAHKKEKGVMEIATPTYQYVKQTSCK